MINQFIRKKYEQKFQEDQVAAGVFKKENIGDEARNYNCSLVLNVGMELDHINEIEDETERETALFNYKDNLIKQEQFFRSFILEFMFNNKIQLSDMNASIEYEYYGDGTIMNHILYILLSKDECKLLYNYLDDVATIVDAITDDKLAINTDEDPIDIEDLNKPLTVYFYEPTLEFQEIGISHFNFHYEEVIKD